MTMTMQAPHTDGGVSVEELKGTFSFSRSIQPRQYEKADAFCAIQFTIPERDGMDPQAWKNATVAAAKEAAFAAKEAVYSELAITAEVDGTGVLREIVERTFGATENVAPPQTQAQPQPAQGGGGYAQPPTQTAVGAVPEQPPYHARTRDKDERAANQEWAIARFNSHPHEFWDNRPKTGNGPDIKHKDSGVGVWF